MAKKIKYIALEDYLLDQDFSPQEVSHSLKKLKEIDKDLKEAFIDCFNEGIEPDIKICDITYQELVSELNMNMVQAFLYLDWLRREPEIALDTIDRTTPMERNEKILQADLTTIPGYRKAEEEEEQSDLVVEEE